MDALRGRWRADCATAAPTADPAAVEDVGTDLLRRWREPHRRYHDLTHLREVLSAVDVLCSSAALGEHDRTVAALAAWFHDAVYTVAAPEGNEAASAALATAALTRLGAPTTVQARVATIVADTADHDLHDDGLDDPARVVVHDADLWVLSAPLERFDAYCRQVREEYAHVPSTAFARGRAAVLRPFLVRPHVYQSAHAREAWEPAARENLARELTRLAG